MEQYGFLINLATCIGCHSCQFACSEKNGLPPGEWFRRVLHVEETGGKEYAGAYSLGCGHCEEPACVRVCPTGAMYKEEENGLVLHSPSRCIGCGSCMWACPYGAPSMNRWTGKSQKCTGCVDTREGRELPACAAACPTGSLVFGSLKELEDTYGECRRQNFRFLPDDRRTVPSVRVAVKRRNTDGEG